MSEPHYNLHLTGRFTEAVEYARHLHVEFRKGTSIPYMAHLLGVASLVLGEAGHAKVSVTEDMVIAALLHDAVEDHGGLPRLSNIEQNFGPEVARMVKGLSDSFTDDHDQKDDWTARKRDYIERLRHEADDVLLISAADKLYNAKTILEDYREIGTMVFERFRRGHVDQLRYFNNLIDVYKSRGKSRLVDEFGRVVKELSTLIDASKG